MDRDGHNIAIARERLAELEAERAAGETDEETYRQARAELENVLAEDIAAGESGDSAVAGGGGRWALGVILLAVPLIAVGLYWQIGSPQMVTGAIAQPTGGGHGVGEGGEMPPVDQLADMLADKLEQNPDNPDGWYLLGRTYMSMQRFQDAAEAFERLYELVGDEPAVLLALADAVAMTQEARISGRPAELAQRALELEPDNTTALWLSGKGAAESGDYLAAVGYWRKVEAQVQDDPQTAAEIRSLIAQAQREGGIPDEQMPPTVAAPEVAAGAAVKVTVALDGSLADKVSPEDTVYVFARALEGPGMPLAVESYRAGDLPVTVTLTDEMAMLPQARLSNFDRVQVGARVSKSGDAMQSSGDLVSESVEVEVADPQDVALVIDTVLP